MERETLIDVWSVRSQKRNVGYESWEEDSLARPERLVSLASIRQVSQEQRGSIQTLMIRPHVG